MEVKDNVFNVFGEVKGEGEGDIEYGMGEATGKLVLRYKDVLVVKESWRAHQHIAYFLYAILRLIIFQLSSFHLDYLNLSPFVRHLNNHYMIMDQE